MYKIALVEDDSELSSMISTMLMNYECEVVVIRDFEQVVEQLLELKADIVLLDINLPYVDGFHICKNLRKESTVPIIMISARNNDLDQILGMELGADDYIIKPFSIEVLHSKIKASIRRAYGAFTPEKSKITIGNFTLDYHSFAVSNGGIEIELTKNEYKILKYLAEKPNELVAREKLLRELWDDVSFIDNNTLNVNISRIKNKLNDIGMKEVIHTKRGYGYKFVTADLEKMNE
ncbi:response regulator transcription factor [Halalkalibacter okhensis]|uniref:Transcriptional regulator n=1 Tax=Halalkalibacter okhensis TaxID=333138 RepID=A0A0B0IIB7_9BACI|nr:response regulator transcription factor [Halalkalibacter okhensis]KHF40632.1 hypothetical protein LQ50_07420 [Halalkalibacter okhensis]